MLVMWKSVDEHGYLPGRILDNLTFPLDAKSTNKAERKAVYSIYKSIRWEARERATEWSIHTL